MKSEAKFEYNRQEHGHTASNGRSVQRQTMALATVSWTEAVASSPVLVSTDMTLAPIADPSRPHLSADLSELVLDWYTYIWESKMTSV
jgi:hypothetical protein